MPEPFFNPLPQGVVNTADLDEAQRAALTRRPEEAAAATPPPDPAAQPAAPADGAPPAAPAHRCRYCGWAADGRPPDWLKPEEYAALVEKLMFEGRYTHTFRLGTVMAVTFRTLTAADEAAVSRAAAGAPVAVNPVAVLEEVQRAASDYEFVMMVARIERGEVVVYTAAEDVKADELPGLADRLFAEPLRAAPIRTAVRRAYHQFYAGVRTAVEKGLAPNF